MKRTDRILIAIALLVLCLTLGAFYGFDFIFRSRDRGDADAIAKIVGGTGDRRIRYKNELHWQRAHDDQKLIFDDAVFSGEGSKVNLKVGNSDLTVDSNTLVVLRKRELFNTLNLNYGALQGLIAKGDKLMIESDGEVVQFSSAKSTSLTISKVNNKMTVRVKSGIAHITRNGHVHSLSPGKAFVIETQPRPDPLQLTHPGRTYFYSRLDRSPVDFAWAYASKKKIAPDDELTVEFAEDPDFQRLVMKEDLKGQSSLRVPLATPGKYFVRIHNGQGIYSQTKTVVLAKPAAPEIISPAPDAEFETPSEQKLDLRVQLKPLVPESRAQVQISNDAEFKKPLVDQITARSEIAVALLPDTYYIRVRSLYEADAVESEWSAPTTISVREPLDANRMAKTGMPYEIVIPNQNYPRGLYKADDAEVQKYVRQTQPFPEFFAAYMRKGYDLVIGRRNTPDPGQKQATPEFPPKWIYPGQIDIVYKMEAGGQNKTKPAIHRLKIVLEPPNGLKSNLKGQLNWSPLLFARSYEGQLRADGKRTTTFVSRTPAHLTLLKPGVRYAYRVRALGRSGTPISDWSQEHQFQTPVPPPPVVEPVLAVEEKKPERTVAQESNSSAMKLNVERSWWDRLGGWIWAGSGFNFVLVRQTIASTADVEYKNTKGPSGFFEAGYLGRIFGAVMSYKRTPGEVRVDNFPVDRRDFIWNTYSAEGLYMLPFRSHILNYPVVWGLRAGMQYHEFPFLFVRSSDHSLVQAANNMTTASLGFFAESIGRIKYHWSMRWQQPVKSSSEGGNQFSISPILGFDGSIGMSYLLNRHFKTGVFWYGQLHDYKFTYASASETNIGKQWLFFSNAEARLGYDF